jgi:hypothetical protein
LQPEEDSLSLSGETTPLSPATRGARRQSSEWRTTCWGWSSRLCGQATIGRGGGYGKSYPVGRFHVHVMFRAFTTYLPIVACLWRAEPLYYTERRRVVQAALERRLLDKFDDTPDKQRRQMDTRAVLGSVRLMPGSTIRVARRCAAVLLNGGALVYDPLHHTQGVCVPSRRFIFRPSFLPSFRECHPGGGRQGFADGHPPRCASVCARWYHRRSHQVTSCNAPCIARCDLSLLLPGPIEYDPVSLCLYQKLLTAQGCSRMMGTLLVSKRIGDRQYDLVWHIGCWDWNQCPRGTGTHRPR